MDTPGKVLRPAEIKLCVHKENNATSKEKSVYDSIPENEISSREDIRVGQLPTSVHCSDYLQQTLSDLMQLNPDDFIIHGDQQRQFSHHVLQDANSESVEDVVCGSSNAGSNLKVTTDGSCSNNNSRSVDITGENNDTNDVYYSHIYDCIVRDAYPEGSSESYCTALKKRARHYCVINGTLYYNRKQPREVITKKHQQQKILQNAHIESETGIHLGAKRMHEAISKTFFWRGMYMDIISFVRDCCTCAESFSESQLHSSAQSKLVKTHEKDNDGDLHANNDNLLDADVEIRIGVWQKVVVKLCGPYPKTTDENEYLITIVDPVSMWVCAKPTTNERNIKTVSTFIIKIFCLLGFAECCFIGFTTQELENIQQHCKGGMFESEITSCVFGGESRQRLETELLGVDECSWSTDLLNDFVNCYPSDWDRKVQSFLHTYHVSTGCDSLTPFYKLHGRNPKFILEANKENRTKDTSINKVPAVFSTREKSPNSVLQIHPNAFEGAQQCATLIRDNCSLLHRKFRRKILAEGQQDGSSMPTGSAVLTERREYLVNRNQQQNTMKISQPSEIRANTVACVKKLLESAKEKKRKRGKYHKYSPEIREEIAQYVAENGAGEAARCFSEKLGRVVSESTVRNIFKLHSNYTPELKQEIGKYALTYGVQAASEHFTQKLGRAIRLGIVHKFKRFYLNQIPAQLKKKIHKKRSNGNRKRHYSDELKEEIGNYAFKYTVGAAIRYYSRKFGYPITETVVRRFRKMYLQKTFDKQSQWNQKQECSSSQQKGEQLQREREQQQIYLNIQENPVRNQIEQALPQNHVHERCTQSVDATSTMQTINILHSSMSVLNDPQFSDTPNDIFPPPCEPAVVASNCSSFDQHTNSALDIQPYIQCSSTVVSSALVFPSQFNNLVDNAPVSTDPNIPVQEYQYNEMYSYYSELGQRREISSISGDNYISSQQLPALSNFSDAELTGKTVSTLNGTPAPRKQQCFHLPNSSNIAADRYVSQIHSVLSQTGDVFFQQDSIQQLTDTNTVIQLNSDQIAGQNSDDILPISKQQGDKFQLHTIPLCYSDCNVPTKTSTEYSVNTLFDDQNNTFLMPHREDCNISTYNKYNEGKAPGIPSLDAQPTVNEVNSTGCDITSGHSYSGQCSSSTMCSLTLQPLEPVVTSILQIHETTAKLNSSPTISTLNSRNSDQRPPISFVTSSTNAPLTQKLLRTSITPTDLVENAGTLHRELVTSPANVRQNPVASLTTSLIKEKQVDTSHTMYSSCSVSVLKETMCSSTSHPPLVQAPVNQPTPLYTVATAASGTTTKSIACAYAIPHAQVEKKKIKIPLMYFSQSQLTEPPPLVAISHPKASVKQCPSHRTVHPVAPVTETFSAIESVTKIPPLAVVSYTNSSLLNDSGQLQNSTVTYQSHSSGKQPPAYELGTALAVSHHKNPKMFEGIVSSEKSLDQRIVNQTRLSGSESLVCPVAKAVMSSVSSSSNTDQIKNKINSLQKKIPHTVASSSSLQYHGTNSQSSSSSLSSSSSSSSSSSVVVSHQITPVTEVTITQATTAQTKSNSVENIQNTSTSYSLQNINTLAAKQNRFASSCSLPHIVHPKVDVSSKIPQLSNLSVTGTRPPTSTVSVQALVTVSDLKHTAINTSSNSHVILKSSETANECRPRVPTVLTSSPVTTAVPVNSISALTSGNDQSDTAGIPIISEYYKKQKDNVKNKYEVMKNLKHSSTSRGKDEIHNPVMTVATMPSYITVTSSNTPLMNLEAAIPCSSTVSNCTSTEGSSFTSSTLTTTKSGNSSQCHMGSTCTNNNSWNGVTRIPSGNNLSDSVTTLYFGNDSTSLSTMLSNKNCSVLESTSSGNSAEVSSTNTSVSKTAISSAVHSFSNSVSEVCYSRAVLKLSESTSNNKNSSTSTDTSFCYKTTGSPSNTSTSHTDATYSSNISSSSKTTPLSVNNPLMCTTSISPSTCLPIGLDTGESEITKSNKKCTKNSNEKPLSRNFKGSKRGNYSAYSPELRAEMGKYAAEHGNQQACLYFKHILGVEVPSSTMRTLRDKYLLKLKHCTFDQKVLNKEVTSLGYGQRGRPMRLGKYDDEVRQCIQEIVKTGEPVSSYLVIETARQVLMQYEPSLLEENGGNIKLNVTWAKSFLKRTGIRNNS